MPGKLSKYQYKEFTLKIAVFRLKLNLSRMKHF